jgi:hypothetical protein
LKHPELNGKKIDKFNFLSDIFFLCQTCFEFLYLILCYSGSICTSRGL